MRNPWSLPSTLLLLLATSAWATANDANIQISNGRRDAHAGLEEPSQRNGALESRENAILRRKLGDAPVAVKKMSNDPGEKFYAEYWQFQVDRPALEELELSGNTSRVAEPRPPFLQHSDDLFAPYSKMRSFPRNIWEKRAYKCPTGTNSCSSIGYPNSCCETDQTCMIITDTGLGNVGCCPSGDTCAGSVTSCDTAQGYTSCPGSSNGGCCIPGYTCDSVGCVAGGTTTITESGSSTITTAAVTILATTTVITSYNQIVTTATVILTEVVIITTSSSIAVSTIYITTTTPTSTAYVGVSTAQTTIYTTITEAVAPERPTSDSTSTTISTTTTTLGVSTLTTTLTTSTSISTSTTTAGYCPTGFYQCSAYYDGGCCQVGLNCDTSSCSSSGATAVVSGSVVTIIVGTGYGVTTVTTDNTADTTTLLSTVSTSTTTATTVLSSSSTTSTAVVVVTTSTTISSAGSGTATCAVGWYGCAAADGGGCCPSGYSCAASCIATQSGEPGHVYKVPADSAASMSIDGLAKWFFGFAGLTGLGMVVF